MFLRPTSFQQQTPERRPCASCNPFATRRFCSAHLHLRPGDSSVAPVPGPGLGPGVGGSAGAAQRFRGGRGVWMTNDDGMMCVHICSHRTVTRPCTRFRQHDGTRATPP